jgi:putative membrane protein
MGYQASALLDQLPDTGSAVAIVFLGLPAVIGLLLSIGLRRGLILFAVLNLVAIILETIGILTGFPYGWFVYGDQSMGAKLFGMTPWTVGLAWAPLVLGAVTLSQIITHRLWTYLLVGTSILIAFDLVLDPAAVSVRLWSYADPGSYYGVPLSNYLGWVLSGLIGVGLSTWIAGAKQLHLMTSLTLMLSLAFWLGVSIQNELILPLSFGSLLMIGYALIASIWWFRQSTRSSAPA